MKKTPFLAISNNEIAAMSALGKTVKCWMCGKRHTVEYDDEIIEGKSVPQTGLGYFRCGGRKFLCGIDGKELVPRKLWGDGYCLHCGSRMWKIFPRDKKIGKYKAGSKMLYFQCEKCEFRITYRRWVWWKSYKYE